MVKVFINGLLVDFHLVFLKSPTMGTLKGLLGHSAETKATIRRKETMFLGRDSDWVLRDNDEIYFKT